MSAEAMPSQEQEWEKTIPPQGYELFRAVRRGIVRVNQLSPIESSPEQEQRDSDVLDALEGRVCGDCGFTGCNCLARED